jgi:RHS repeat-associated protein
MYAYHPGYIDAVANRMRANDAHVYVHDANFNVTVLVEPDYDVAERYDYTPYGEALVLDANFALDSDGLSDVQNEILYTGRWVDSNTGLQLNRNRWYHQQLGRWTSRDPVGERKGVGSLFRGRKGDAALFSAAPLPCWNLLSCAQPILSGMVQEIGTGQESLWQPHFQS